MVPFPFSACLPLALPPSGSLTLTFSPLSFTRVLEGALHQNPQLRPRTIQRVELSDHRLHPYSWGGASAEAAPLIGGGRTRCGGRGPEVELPAGPRAPLGGRRRGAAWGGVWRIAGCGSCEPRAGRGSQQVSMGGVPAQRRPGVGSLRAAQGRCGLAVQAQVSLPCGVGAREASCTAPRRGSEIAGRVGLWLRCSPARLELGTENTCVAPLPSSSLVRRRYGRDFVFCKM